MTSNQDELQQFRRSQAGTEDILMALTAEVQALVTQVTQNTSAEASAEAAMTVLSGQVATLTKLQSAPTVAAALDPADLAAIVAQTTLLSSSLAALTPAIPANVPPPAAAPVAVTPAVVAAAATSVAPPAPPPAA
jgi:hypothetical protein